MKKESLHKRFFDQALLKTMLFFVGINGCFSVLFGAWLAHGGQALSLVKQSNLATALHYQFFHTLALLICLVWLKSNSYSKVIMGSCFAFAVGILCFSGAIYIKSLFEWPLVGKLTPFGGLAFAIGWLLVAVESKNKF